jgi:hypothetical protein
MGKYEILKMKDEGRVRRSLKIGNRGFLGEINEKLMKNCISSLNEHSRERERHLFLY